MYAHIEPQQPCVVSANGGWAVDFIGRVEHMDEDLGAVLRELERRRPQDAPPVGGPAAGRAAPRCMLGRLWVCVPRRRGGAAWQMLMMWPGITLCLPASPCFPSLLAGTVGLVAATAAALQIKQLDHSLENVNGRGCNETGEGGLLPPLLSPPPPLLLPGMGCLYQCCLW